MSRELEDLIKALPKETTSFFFYFSRFEYALKKLGGKYLKGDEERAEPDWGELAKELGTSFYDEVKHCRMAEALLAKPPKKQIVVNGKLDWKCVQVNDVQSLFDAVRRVRNNLFHGGKFSHGHVVEDVSRNKKLLEQARRILDLALEKCAELKGVFWKIE